MRLNFPVLSALASFISHVRTAVWSVFNWTASWMSLSCAVRWVWGILLALWSWFKTKRKVLNIHYVDLLKTCFIAGRFPELNAVDWHNKLAMATLSYISEKFSLELGLPGSFTMLLSSSSVFAPVLSPGLGHSLLKMRSSFAFLPLSAHLSPAASAPSRRPWMCHWGRVGHRSGNTLWLLTRGLPGPHVVGVGWISFGTTSFSQKLLEGIINMPFTLGKWERFHRLSHTSQIYTHICILYHLSISVYM